MASARCTFSSDNMVIKSPNDSRLYRLIELDNGLQALLIHDPEIYPDGPPKTLENGEQVDEENDDDAEGSEEEEEEEEDEDEDEDDEEDEDEEDEDEDEEVKEKGKKGSSSQTKKVSLCLNLNKVTECESNSPFGC
jgi:nardilysin